MFRTFILAVLLAGVNCRYLLVEDRPLRFAEDGVLGEEAVYFNGPLEAVQLEPLFNPRVRRQAQTTISVDGKTGNTEIFAKNPIAHTDSNVLSVIGSQSDTSRSIGLALDNVNGHALSISQKMIPDFGEQLTAAGKVNLLRNDKHDVNANGFITKNMPKFDDLPAFKTYGGGIDYTFNKKIGASLDAARTDLLQRTDVNALGHLNLFRNKDTSFDFNAGAKRSFSPFIPKSSWEPTFGFSFSKSW